MSLWWCALSVSFGGCNLFEASVDAVFLVVETCLSRLDSWRGKCCKGVLELRPMGLYNRDIRARYQYLCLIARLYVYDISCFIQGVIVFTPRWGSRFHVVGDGLVFGLGDLGSGMRVLGSSGLGHDKGALHAVVSTRVDGAVQPAYTRAILNIFISTGFVISYNTGSNPSTTAPHSSGK